MERNISTIIIGMAHNMDGTISDQVKQTRIFQHKLSNLISKAMTYIEWDERLTTFEARNSLGHIGTKNIRQNIDDVAASILLQSYLDALKH
jgi:putative Holliday junction resolvase